ncbi:DNA polymerase III subunit theta [Morganella morganii]
MKISESEWDFFPGYLQKQQPEHLRPYFRERLEHYREIGKRFPRGFEYEKN